MPLIFDIKRFALHDGPGIRTTIFLKGCPLRCLWCHNPESHNSKPEEYAEIRVVDGREITMKRIYGKEVGIDELIREILKDRVFFEESGGGVTFSGGEPMMQFDSLLPLLKELGEKGIHRTVDTCGYADPAELTAIADHTDLFLYDLKLMDPVTHKQYTGADNRLILENADMLLNYGSDVIFRIPVLPGINDTKAEINAMKVFLSHRRYKFREVHLLPYHKTGSEKYRKMSIKYEVPGLETPSEEGILKIVNDFISCGLNVSTGG